MWSDSLFLSPVLLRDEVPAFALPVHKLLLDPVLRLLRTKQFCSMGNSLGIPTARYTSTVTPSDPNTRSADELLSVSSVPCPCPSQLFALWCAGSPLARGFLSALLAVGRVTPVFLTGPIPGNVAHCRLELALTLSIWLELRRLPPIMGFVGSGARAGDPSCLELR